jgi:hypothetical protein
MRLSVPIFTAYIFTIIIYTSLHSGPFINMKEPSLSLLKNFYLKSILSDIAILACF